MFRLRIRVAWTSWFPASEKPIRNRAIPNEIGSTKLLSKLLLLSLKSLEFTCMVVVQAMVLDVLHGRSPLYRIEQFIEQQHRELLLGQEIDPHLFNDSTIARSLDALFAAGPSKIITQLGIRAVQVFELDMHALSYDTTSTSVWGEYRGSEEKSSLNAMLTRISSLLARHGLGPGACNEQAGCFVILTNVPLESLDAASVLRTYKGQYGIESDFSLSALSLDERVFYDKQVRCVLTRRHA